MRLGFAVKVPGAGGNLATIPANAGMPSNDARKWQSGPHVRQSITDLSTQVRLLDARGCGPDVVTHVGGVYGDREASLTRFIRRRGELPERTRCRIVVENDDVNFSATEALRIHAETGCPVVFDNLHHFCFNPEGLPMRDAFQAARARPQDPLLVALHLV